MLGQIENIRILNAFYGISVKYLKHEKRASHALVIKLSGKSVYRFSDRSVMLEAGQAILINEGACYTVSRIGSDGGRYAIINFKAELSQAHGITLGVADLPKLLFEFDELSRVVLVDHEKNRFLALSHFYRILSMLSSEIEGHYLNTSKSELLRPAVAYIGAHIFDTDMRIESLHGMCGISDVYFRKLFSEYMGSPPRRYITEKRLERARALIAEGAYDHLYDVSASVGFSDPLYFSRVFKKRYGISPRGVKINTED